MLDDIKKTVWATADKLRAQMAAAECKHLMLGLIFLKYIADTFQARRAELRLRPAAVLAPHHGKVDDPCGGPRNSSKRSRRFPSPTGS